MNEFTRNLEACRGYIDLGMYHDAWNELERMPPELRAKVDVIDLRLKSTKRSGSGSLPAFCRSRWPNMTRQIRTGGSCGHVF
jgi:hypothetical protein